MQLTLERNILSEYSPKLAQYYQYSKNLKEKDLKNHCLRHLFLMNSASRPRHIIPLTNKSKINLTKNSIGDYNTIILNNNTKNFAIKIENYKNIKNQNFEKRETHKQKQKYKTKIINESKDSKKTQNFLKTYEKIERNYNFDKYIRKNQFISRNFELVYQQKRFSFSRSKSHEDSAIKTIINKKRFILKIPTKKNLFFNPSKIKINRSAKVIKSKLANINTKRVFNMKPKKTGPKLNLFYSYNTFKLDKTNKNQIEFHSSNRNKLEDGKEKIFIKNPKSITLLSTINKNKYKTIKKIDVDSKYLQTKIIHKKGEKNESKKEKNTKILNKLNHIEKKISITLFPSMNVSEMSKKNENIQINKIKTNDYVINKPQEINMKYKIRDGIASEETNEPVTKITIGVIEGYKDIIEKDKILNGFISHINYDKSSSKIIISNESNDIERELVDLMKSKYDQKNISDRI